MKRRSEKVHKTENLRDSIIGMGKDSLRKNYFPLLKKRVAELERYKALLDQAHDAICLISSDNFQFLECNLSGQKLLSETEKIITSPLDFIHDESDKKQLRSWLETPESGSHYSFTFSLQADKGTIYCTCTLTHVSFENSPYFISLIHDITEQRRLEEELYQTRKMDAIGQLAGGVAHDFNNMLAGIIGAAEVIKSSTKENTAESTMLDLILQTAQRASDLTAKLLSFSRKGKIRSTAVNIHTIIGDTIEILKRSIDKRITIETQLKAQHSLIIGDPSQLQNAILNLSINARDAIEGSGFIKITTVIKELSSADLATIPFDLSEGPHIALSITDSGCGIPKENIKSIFEPFFTTKETGKGTGLGLAAVYGTIVDHRGAITVESSPGSGTTFTLLFPLEEVTITTPSPSIETAVKGKGKILIVDDEEILRTTAKFILSDLGYKLLLASDGEEALELFHTTGDEIDCIILDMVMPVMSGEECFAKIRALDSDVPIIIASGFPKSKRIETMLSRGLTAFIQKPYSRANLSHLLNEILHS